MTTYDQIALNDKPVLYLSSPTNTDKSGTGLFALSNNNLSATGQPVIYGSEFSYYMDSTNTVDVTGNPIFFNDTATFECVVIAGRPEQDVSILIDDNSSNSLYITPEGISIKLFFENMSSTYAQIATVPVKDWNKKLYIVLTISDTQATLSVNGKSTNIIYAGNIIPSSNIIIGGGYTNYFYLVDGIGFYNNTISNKSTLIDDPLSGHSNFAASKHSGTTTKFDGYTSGKITTFSLSDFLYSDGIHTLIYYSAYVQDGLDYLSIRTNDERVTVTYDINLDDSGTFTEYLLIGTVENASLRFMVNDIDVDSDFTITIESVNNGDVLYDTPADLILSGLALYSLGTESIVNFPDGVKLPGSAYTGTWIYSDVMTTTPKSVEIVFKPEPTTVDTIVFASTDGNVSFGPTGAITGFTAYLNGQLVTDLTGLRLSQWNHIVITKNTTSATEFYLNSPDGLAADTNLSYMLLTAYPNELTSDEISILYEIMTGTDLITLSESAIISEGSFTGGSAFNVYSYTWSIVGAGGT